MTPFGAQLRRLRAKRRVPLKQLAAAIEVSAAYLSALEHGHRGVPSVMLLHQVIDALALTWEEADELEHLARLSHPRVVVDTAGLAPDRTALANPPGPHHPRFAGGDGRQTASRARRSHHPASDRNRAEERRHLAVTAWTPARPASHHAPAYQLEDAVPNILTEAQIATYRQDGFVHPLRAFDPAQAETYATALRRDCAQADRPVSDAGIRQPSTRVKSYLLFPWAAELIRHPAILDAVEQVIGPDILAFHSTVWFKPAHSEGRVPWHQDGTYFGLAPYEHVTAWIALTPSTLESGCVRVLPGSHTSGQRAHEDHKDTNIMLSRGQTIRGEVDEAAAVPLLLQPGQFSLHHTMVLHASSPNHADHDRIGIGISYIPAHVKHIGTTRLAASLVRGEDRHGHFALEPRPRASADAAAVAAHAESLDRFWHAAEAIPEMALVH